MRICDRILVCRHGRYSHGNKNRIVLCLERGTGLSQKRFHGGAVKETTKVTETAVYMDDNCNSDKGRDPDSSKDKDRDSHNDISGSSQTHSDLAEFDKTLKCECSQTCPTF